MKSINDFQIYATSGDLPGEVDIQWDTIPDAKNYIIRVLMKNGNASRWKMSDIISDSHYTVTELKPNTVYFFRVTAVTGKGRGPLSNIAMKKAT